MNLYLKNIRKSILIICLLLVGSAIYAQNSSKITIKRKNISLQEALAEVRKLTHMSISYNDSQLPVNRISLDIEKQPLEQALKVILKGTGFTYLIKDNYIMIVPEQNIKKAKSRNISGNVVDAKGEPLIGVTVIEKGTTNGAVTDLDGNYKITMEDFSGLSPRCSIFSGTDDFSGNFLISPTTKKHHNHIIFGEVILKKYVQVGTNSVIMPNLVLKEGTAIGEIGRAHV